jgi:threonine dehydratase
MYTKESFVDAQRSVYAATAPTPQLQWPLLNQRVGAQVWVKHENHSATAAFKIRGALTYFDGLRQRDPACKVVVSATRGNHGQALGFAARQHGLAALIVVPRGNSVEKNAAMRALGVELVEHGDDFQAAREHAAALARAQRLHMVPSFHDDLVRGVATYWIEFFNAVQPDVVFVPIGLGSGICACVAARAHLGVSTRIVGVVSAHATAYQQSFRARQAIEAPVSTLLADGMACRAPDAQALEIICREVDDVIAVTDDEVGAAMRALFCDTHNVAEGAGAASLAGALQQRSRWAGRTVGVTLTGGNVDSEVFARVLRSA